MQDSIAPTVAPTVPAYLREASGIGRRSAAGRDPDRGIALRPALVAGLRTACVPSGRQEIPTLCTAHRMVDLVKLRTVSMCMPG